MCVCCLYIVDRVSLGSTDSPGTQTLSPPALTPVIKSSSPFGLSERLLFQGWPGTPYLGQDGLQPACLRSADYRFKARSWKEVLLRVSRGRENVILALRKWRSNIVYGTKWAS